MISILSKAATWSPEQPFGEAFSRVFSSRLCSAQLIWTAVGESARRMGPDVPDAQHFEDAQALLWIVTDSGKEMRLKEKEKASPRRQKPLPDGVCASRSIPSARALPLANE